MAVQPPVQPGQISPDGMWRWDGAQWVPLIGQPIARPRTRPWIWWLAGGCALLLVIGLVGAGFGVYSLVRTVQQSATTCLPSDFPSYPNAQIAGENVYYGTGLPAGDNEECSMTLSSNDDVATITRFYQDKLNSGVWEVSQTNTATGEIQFLSHAKSSTTGTLELLGHGQQTEIRIVLYS